MKTAFFRDKVEISFAEEEEKGKVLQDTMAANEETAKNGLTSVSESMTSIEEEYVKKNASYFEKVEEVSGSYEIIDTMIGNWGNNSLEQREQDVKNLETIDAPLDEHSGFAQSAFVKANANLENALTSTALVNEEVLAKEETLQEMQQEVDDNVNWLNEKIADRKEKSVGLIDDAASEFGDSTTESLDELQQGDVFKGTFITENAGRGYNFLVWVMLYKLYSITYACKFKYTICTSIVCRAKKHNFTLVC